jgi:hypothetical protein
MTGMRIGLGLCLVFTIVQSAPAQLLSRSVGSRLHPPASATSSSSPSLFDAVNPAVRGDVMAVVQKPTMTAKHSEEPFTCNPTVYKWLLEHPDRTALAWERIGVPCLPIKERTAGQYQFKDDSGTDVSWQAVGTIPDGRVWYATGKVKPGLLMPTVPVKAVAVVRYPATAPLNGKVAVAPNVSLFFQTDSRTASTILRMAGPAAPRMADEGAEQLLFFFSGMARYLDKHPDQTAALLSPPKKAVGTK